MTIAHAATPVLRRTSGFPASVAPLSWSRYSEFVRDPPHCT
ncbi:hypothetical protein [Cryobacterium sp. TMT3-29-2]|nr:hypothetical protein [Cryobacterium sp. TMT3-29-2]